MFGSKEYNQSDFGVDHLVMSMYRVFSCVVGRECLLLSVCSLGKTLLAFALFHSIFRGQICLLPQVFLDFLHGRRRAERSCSTFKVKRGVSEAIPLLQGKEQQLRFAGAAVRRYPMSKVRETQVRR